MAKKKTNEEFLAQLSAINPSILSIEQYKDAKTPIRCKCKKCSYEWDAIPNNLLRGEGCKKCAGNSRWTTDEFISRMAEINPDVIIVGKYVNSKTPIEYICKTCGRENASVPSSLLNGHGCRYCAREASAKKRTMSNEDFLLKLSETNPGIIPLEPYISSETPIQCRCVCGNIWKISPDNLYAGKKCRKCQSARREKPISSYVRPIKSNDIFLSEMATVNPTIEPLEAYRGATIKINVRCKICGSVWATRPSQLLKGQGCKSCQKRFQTSFPEQAIFYYLKQIFPNIISSYKDGFGKSELDIYIPSSQIAIEYDGRKWHKHSLDIEVRKYEICKEKGIKLIRIREITTGCNPDSICDYMISSRYGESKRFSDLDDCIMELFQYMKISCSIDTQQDQISIRSQYYGYMKDKSLGYLYPKIAEEWYQPKNGIITPYMVSPKSNETFYWKCPNCGKVYPAVVSSRTSGHACASCAGVEKKSQEQFVDAVHQRYPYVVVLGNYINSNTSIQYLCNRCGKVNSSLARNLLNNGCKYCNQRRVILGKSMTHEEFLSRAQILYPTVEFLGKYVNSKSRVLCKCKVCNHEWTPIASSILSGNTGCSSCSKRKGKKVLCIETGIVYGSINQAEKETHVSHSSISTCCSGKGLTAGGFHWKYVEV